MVSRVTSEKLLKAFSLKPCIVSTQEAVDVQCSSPGEAPYFGANSVTLRPLVPDISEITHTHTHTHMHTDTHTHTQNTRINMRLAVTRSRTG